MENKFKIGDRVSLANVRFHYEEAYDASGAVTDVSAQGKIFVTWDNRYVKDSVHDASQLISEEEAHQKWDALEKEWDDLSSQVKQLLTDAQTIVEKASVLADSKGFEIKDLHDANSPMYSMIRLAGWRTSSLGC